MSPQTPEEIQESRLKQGYKEKRQRRLQAALAIYTESRRYNLANPPATAFPKLMRQAVTEADQLLYVLDQTEET